MIVGLNAQTPEHLHPRGLKRSLIRRRMFACLCFIFFVVAFDRVCELGVNVGGYVSWWLCVLECLLIDPIFLKE